MAITSEWDMVQRKKTITEIAAEKMALLAEQGLKKARLTRDEKRILADNGLDELYEIRECLRTPTLPAAPELIEKMMGSLFPKAEVGVSGTSLVDISVRLTTTAMEVIRHVFDWQLDSPAFAQRGDESDVVSFFREAGKYTVHFQIVKGDQKRASINVRLTDKLHRGLSSFEASLFQNGQCIESVHVTRNPVASFPSVIPGDYLVKVSNKKGEIVSVAVRIEA